MGILIVKLSGCGGESTWSVDRLDTLVESDDMIVYQARMHYYRGEFIKSIDLFMPLCEERTRNQPLYLCELGTSYLACNKKTEAKECLIDAYTSLESLIDPALEEKAMSLWGEEAEKVYRGDPYEQATLSLLMGMLLLEEGNVDNALSCFKNGQLADSDVESEQYQSDYGLLQMLEAKCYQMRQEYDEYHKFSKMALTSFAKTRPASIGYLVDESIPIETDRTRTVRGVEKDQVEVVPYNTLLLLWTGKAPVFHRTGEYGEKRIIVKNSSPRMAYGIEVDGAQWHDEIVAHANLSFQATTRGGREMDNVLASQADFKNSASYVGNTFLKAADGVGDPFVALALVGIGLASHSMAKSTQVQADIRCWRTLPDCISVIPLQLKAGTHKVQIRCLDEHYPVDKTEMHTLSVKDQPFQFYNIVFPEVASNN